MTTTADSPGVASRARTVLAVPAPRPPVLDVVVPVHNEQDDLVPSVERLHAHLASLPYSFRITIADNASTDATLALARRLAARLPGVTVVHLAEKGRGRALRQVWSRSDAEVLAYMDVDLSTDLAALLPLVAPLISGHSDLAIGSRLARGSRVVRGPKREVISRGYNLLLRTALATRFSDAQCGFKAIRADRAARAAAARRGHRLVLRHRAAGARRAPRAAHPRGARRLGGRPGLARRHRLDRDGRPARHRAPRPRAWPPGGSR